MLQSMLRGARCVAVATLTLVLGTVGTAQSKFRPLEDFLSKQGTQGANFWPPVPDYLGWFDAKSINFAIMDYAGIAAKYLKDQTPSIDLGTKIEGYVKEELIPGDSNRRLVTVLMHTRNALSFAAPLPTPPSFPYPLDSGIGYRADGDAPNDVVSGKPAALGSCLLHLVFITNNNGGALPDLLQIAFSPNPGEELLVLKFDGTTQGDLRDPYPSGSKGALHITQIGMFTKANPGFPANGFTAELVEIKQTGR